MFFVQNNKMTTFMIIVYGGLMFAFFFRESFCYMQITQKAWTILVIGANLCWGRVSQHVAKSISTSANASHIS